MLIKRIEIKGFQSHINSAFDFTDGINVITGPSNTGKSAVFKAINWLFHDEPSGSQFINGDTAHVKLECETDKGSLIIERIKGDDNVYIINGKKFSRFGRDKKKLPIEVQNLKNLISDYNFQKQGARLFLIDEAGVNRLNTINDFINLKNLFAAIQNQKKSIKQINAEIDSSDASLVQLEDDNKKNKTDLLRLEKEIKYLQFEEQRNNLSIIITRILDYQKEINQYLDIITAANKKIEKINKIKLFYQDSKALKVVLDGIADLNNKINGLEQSINKKEITLKNVSKISDLSQQRNKFNKYIDLQNSINKIEQTISIKDNIVKLYREKYKILKNLLEITDENRNISTLDKQINNCKAELDKTIDVIHSGLQICPICNNKIDDKDSAMEHLKKFLGG